MKEGSAKWTQHRAYAEHSDFFDLEKEANADDSGQAVSFANLLPGSIRHECLPSDVLISLHFAVTKTWELAAITRLISLPKEKKKKREESQHSTERYGTFRWY